MKLTKRQRALLVAPILFLPFVAILFSALGGGKGVKKTNAGLSFGLNTELPGIFTDPKKEVVNKLGAYLKEEQDSIRKKQYELRDPYITPAHGSGVNQPQDPEGP